jgi:hypothetical protein
MPALRDLLGRASVAVAAVVRAFGVANPKPAGAADLL